MRSNVVDQLIPLWANNVYDDCDRWCRLKWLENGNLLENSYCFICIPITRSTRYVKRIIWNEGSFYISMIIRKRIQYKLSPFKSLWLKDIICLVLFCFCWLTAVEISAIYLSYPYISHGRSSKGNVSTLIISM